MAVVIGHVSAWLHRVHVISYLQVSSKVVLKASLKERAKRTSEMVTAAHFSSVASHSKVLKF